MLKLETGICRCVCAFCVSNLFGLFLFFLLFFLGHFHSELGLVYVVALGFFMFLMLLFFLLQFGWGREIILFYWVSCRLLRNFKKSCIVDWVHDWIFLSVVSFSWHTKQQIMSGIAQGRLQEERKAWRRDHPHVREKGHWSLTLENLDSWKATPFWELLTPQNFDLFTYIHVFFYFLPRCSFHSFSFTLFCRLFMLDLNKEKTELQI